MGLTLRDSYSPQMTSHPPIPLASVHESLCCILLDHPTSQALLPFPTPYESVFVCGACDPVNGISLVWYLSPRTHGHQGDGQQTKDSTNFRTKNRCLGVKWPDAHHNCTYIQIVGLFWVWQYSTIIQKGEQFYQENSTKEDHSWSELSTNNSKISPWSFPYHCESFLLGWAPENVFSSSFFVLLPSPRRTLKFDCLAGLRVWCECTCLQSSVYLWQYVTSNQTETVFIKLDVSLHGVTVVIPTSDREIPGSTPGRYNLQIKIPFKIFAELRCNFSKIVAAQFIQNLRRVAVQFFLTLVVHQRQHFRGFPGDFWVPELPSREVF